MNKTETIGEMDVIKDSPSLSIAESAERQANYSQWDRPLNDGGSPLARTDSSKSKKRQSLKLCLSDFSFVSASSPGQSFSDESSLLMSPIHPKSGAPHTYNHHRRMESSPAWSRASTPEFGSNAGSKRSSLHASIEQDQVLQEKLQELARSDNARLLNPILDLSISEGFSQKYSSSSSNGASKGHSRHHSAHSMFAFRNSSGHLSGHTFSSSYPKMPMRARATVPSASRRWKRKDGSILVMREDDIVKLEKLEPAPGSPGPNRPGEIQGTVLSWKMTQDLLKTITSGSGADATELLQFMWSMFSQPENVLETFKAAGSPHHILPPKELVNGLRRRLPRILRLQLIPQLFDLLKGLVCTGLVFTVMALQVALVAMMLVAYVVGDGLLLPVKYFWPNGKAVGRDKLSGKRSVRRAALKQTKRRKRHD